MGKRKYNRYNPMPQSERDEIAAAYYAGKSSPVIAKEFGVSKFCVLYILKKEKCEMRDKHKFRLIEKDIISDYLSIKNAALVAKKYNTSNTQVFKILERHNIESLGCGQISGPLNPLWKGGKKRRAERMLKYVKNRYAEEPLFKIETLCRSRIRTFLKTVNIRKKKKTIDMLGSDWSVIREYIESQFIDDMSWENHGRHGWHLDHKVPLASAQTEEELTRLFHYTNLQPLWHKENLAKSSFHNGVHHYRRNRSLL